MRLGPLALTMGTLAALPLGCKKDEQPPPQPPPAYQPYPTQPAPAQPAPVATQPVPAQPTAAPPAPAAPAAPGTPAPAGGMSQPSPMALACSSDAACLTHRCNTQFGKCAWPCQSDNDCVTGNHCMAGACVPKMQ